MKTLELMNNYKSIEKFAKITLDDILHKVTQEVCELIEAHHNWNLEEQHKEAWDVIVNVLSACVELWVEIEDEYIAVKKSPVELAILLWKWNSKVQWYRKRYSRDTVVLQDIQLVTKELLDWVMSYTDKQVSIADIIIKNTKKFDSRKELYIRD